jgi:hypothetical protein
MQRKRKSRHALESHRHRRVGPRTHDYGRLRRKPAAVGAIAGFESCAERPRTESAVAESAVAESAVADTESADTHTESARAHTESTRAHTESTRAHTESTRSDSW